MGMQYKDEKKAKERECELDHIKIEDIRLLELIRWVRDPKLKELQPQMQTLLEKETLAWIRPQVVVTFSVLVLRHRFAFFFFVSSSNPKQYKI